MKKTLTTLIILFACNLHAQDNDGFYVIPVITEKVIIDEVCTGTPIGGVIFTITDTPTGFIEVGDVYFTTQGQLVEKNEVSRLEF